MAFVAGHKAQVGAAEGQGHAQRLAFAHGDVRPVFSGGLQQAQGDGVDPHDDLGPGLMGGGHDGVHVLQHPVVVGAAGHRRRRSRR